MSALGVSLELEIDGLRRLIDRLEPPQLASAFDTIGEAGVSLARRSVQRSRNAYGEPYQALDPETLRRKPGGNPRPLISKDAGLLNSLNHQVHRGGLAGAGAIGVEIGTPRPHAKYHQGDESHPSKGIIPERSFLPKPSRGLGRMWSSEILATLDAYIGG